METIIYLIRHGQSRSNVTHTFAGHTDIELSELGVEQAKATCQELADVNIDAVYSSDLKRAAYTASVHAELRHIPCILDKRLREIYLGEWEDAPVEFIKTNYTELYYNSWVDNFGEFCAPGGECIPDLAERMYETILDLAKQNEGKAILIASHAAAIRAFWGKISNIPQNELAKSLPFPTNASYSKIIYDGERLIPIEYSSDEHLGKLLTKWVDK